MELNPDCIRDILISVEEAIVDVDTAFYYTSAPDGVPQSLKKYDADEIKYHLRQCEFSQFFTFSKWDMAHGYEIHDLTPKAHEFLANIRSDTIWNRTKNFAKNIGTISLDALTKIATGVITEMIKQSLQSP